MFHAQQPISHLIKYWVIYSPSKIRGGQGALTASWFNCAAKVGIKIYIASDLSPTLSKFNKISCTT